MLTRRRAGGEHACKAMHRAFCALQQHLWPVRQCLHLVGKVLGFVAQDVGLAVMMTMGGSSGSASAHRLGVRKGSASPPSACQYWCMAVSVRP